MAILTDDMTTDVCMHISFYVAREIHVSFDTVVDGAMHALAFDWIAENLYVATRAGYVVVCHDDARATKAFHCRPVLFLCKFYGDLRGIAVDPNEGY